MLRLALFHLKYNKLLSAILTLCLTVSIFLPLSTCLATSMLKSEMTARAGETPLLVGAKGSPFLLALNAVYFKTEIQDTVTQSVFENYRRRCRGTVIPLHTGHTAHRFPVVGTSYDYFAFRRLEVAEGRLPAMLGEAVAGAQAARSLRLKPGGCIITDSENIYDISAEYPLKLRITGVLAPAGSPDDHAIFTDVKTAWVIDGIGHGHEDAIAAPEKVHDDSILFIEASEVVYNSRLAKYNEITPENIDTFHFHGDAGRFPLSALIVVPESHKEKTLVWSETRLGPEPEEGAPAEPQLQAVKPAEVVADILRVLFDIKKVLDGLSGLVLLSTAAFLFLVLTLLLRLRKDEMEVIYRIGGSRHAIKLLLGVEISILLAASFVLAAAAAFALVSAAQSALLG